MPEGTFLSSESGSDQLYAFYSDGILRDLEGNIVTDESGNTLYDGWATSSSGSLDVSESSVDSFASSGSVLSVSGRLLVNEYSLPDTFTGDITNLGISSAYGTLNVSESSLDTLTSIGLVTSVPVVTPSTDSIPVSKLPLNALYYDMKSLTPKVYIIPEETVFVGRDNVLTVQLSTEDGYVDLSDVTKISILNKDNVIEISSDTYPSVFDWSLGDGKISMNLNEVDISPNIYYFYLILFDTVNVKGLVWNVLSIDFKVTYN